MKWHQRWIERAEHIASWSKDQSTTVGCVLIDPSSNTVVSEGYNGFPRRVDDNVAERWERPAKYLWTEHAERNAVFNAARLGRATLGTWAYMNFAPTPCTDCARALIQAGVVRIIGPDSPFPGVGAGTHYSLSESGLMLHEAGVEVLGLEVF